MSAESGQINRLIGKEGKIPEQINFEPGLGGTGRILQAHFARISVAK